MPLSLSAQRGKPDYIKQHPAFSAGLFLFYKAFCTFVSVDLFCGKDRFFNGFSKNPCTESANNVRTGFYFSGAEGIDRIPVHGGVYRTDGPCNSVGSHSGNLIHFCLIKVRVGDYGAYGGVKAEFAKSVGVKLLRESNATTHSDLFATVSPNYKTAKDFTTNVSLFTLTKGITKMRIYMWIEGQDVDCENNASGADISYNLQVTTIE